MWKPILPSMCIIAGRVNASAKKSTSGSVLRTSANSQAQKLTGLVCGLSTRKIADAVAHPQPHDLEPGRADALGGPRRS